MTKDEALRIALEALENAPIEYDFHGNPMDVEFGKQLDAAITALRQALEQPEPMCWVTPDGVGWRMRIEPPVNDVPLGWTPLYDAPPKREWQGLTDEERYLNDCRSEEDIEYARAIEAKLREKNGF